MPLYEYACKNCAKINEKLMKFSDPAPEICEFCHGGPLVKLVSKTNFVLKGQGWYETDFKNKPKPTEKAIDTSAPAAATSPAPVTAPAEPKAATSPAAEAAPSPKSET